MSVTRAAYLAGVIDADGFIGWRGTRHQAPIIGVANTSEQLMDWLQREVGASRAVAVRVCPQDCSRQLGRNHVCRVKPIWRWQMSGERAAVVLRALLPYLVIKRDRAVEVLDRYYAHVEQMAVPEARRRAIARNRDLMAQRGWVA